MRERELFFPASSRKPSRRTLAKRSRCRDCHKKNAIKYYNSNKEKVKFGSYLSGLKRKYNLSKTEYYGMLNGQGGVCLVCKEPSKMRGLAVDHDHKTGRVRGLLCISCNGALGMVNDSPKVLRLLADYLEQNI